jgi:maleylacetate reductase
MSDKLKAAMQHDIDYKYQTKSDPPDVRPPPFTMINVPTTLSAGEYSPYAGGIDATDGVKKIFVLQSLFADVVILDPELAQHSPEWVWMSSGVRSIDHCVELLGSLNPDVEAETEEAAVQGLIEVVRGLLKLRKDPKDLRARLETQIGSNHAMDGKCRLPCLETIRAYIR